VRNPKSLPPVSSVAVALSLFTARAGWNLVSDSAGIAVVVPKLGKKR